MAEEIELKLLMQPQDFSQLDALMQALGSEKAEVNRLENTYYDTPTLDLHHHRAALRLRHTGKGWVQTLKTSGEMRGALSRRGEWEEPIPEPRLHPEKLPEGILQPQWLAALQPLFTTHFTRTTWQLSRPLTASELRVEIAADQGQAQVFSDTQKASAKKNQISEVELELKAGPPEALFALARQLAENIVLHPGLASKAEKGLCLLLPTGFDALKKPQLGEQTRFDSLNALANDQLNRWIQCHEHWAFSADESYLQDALRALLRLQGLLVVQQRLCSGAPLHQARIDVKKLLQAFMPLVLSSHKDRILQRPDLINTLEKEGQQSLLGYMQRRSAYRHFWQQQWTGLAELNLLESLYDSRCLSSEFSPEAPQRLLAAARAHLRFPRQPMEADAWVQRYPALIRLQQLLEQVTPQAQKDLELAAQLVAGIEDLQGYQQLLQEAALPEQLRPLLTAQRQELLFNLGRWAQALWTNDPTQGPAPAAPA